MQSDAGQLETHSSQGEEDATRMNLILLLLHNKSFRITHIIMIIIMHVWNEINNIHKLICLLLLLEIYEIGQESVFATSNKTAR